jgi:hypothetical protein
VNATSSGNYYYTYVTGGSFELTAALEAGKYRLAGDSDRASTDGGSSTGLFEVGSNLSLQPTDYGDSSLVGYWRFNDGSGTSAYDASGNGRTGTLTNGPTWQTFESCASGGCVRFDGTNDYVDIGAVPHPTEFTKGAWVKINVADVCGGGEATRCSVIGPYFEVDTSNRRVEFYGNQLNPNGWHFTPNNSIVNNQWHMVTAAYGSGTLRLYIDGALRQEVSAARTGTIDSSAIIGAYSSPTLRFFSGFIDDVRIYNRALSTAEISAIYNATK